MDGSFRSVRGATALQRSGVDVDTVGEFAPDNVDRRVVEGPQQGRRAAHRRLGVHTGGRPIYGDVAA
jgi:hypothetical protein